jgi:predicted adenylyl cyclase CyaB
MLEIEIKILEINKEEIIKKILATEGTLVTPQRLLVAQKFDTPNKDIKNKNNLFRIRKDGEKVEVTYKINRNQDDGFRKAEEIQTTVGDFETMQNIILALGFVPTQYQEKKRTTYSLCKTLVEIDELPNIPAYIEVEGEEKNISEVVQLLGFLPEEISTLSASDVLRHYNVDPKHVAF